MQRSTLSSLAKGYSLYNWTLTSSAASVLCFLQVLLTAERGCTAAPRNFGIIIYVTVAHVCACGRRTSSIGRFSELETGLQGFVTIKNVHLFVTTKHYLFPHPYVIPTTTSLRDVVPSLSVSTYRWCHVCEWAMQNCTESVEKYREYCPGTYISRQHRVTSFQG